MSDHMIRSYESIPYESHARRASYVPHLALLGRVQGVVTADPATCSVLELGCGSGANLISMAERFPSAHFTGIDIVPRHIEEAERTGRAIKLENVSFRSADIENLGAHTGTFDYIICHGVYSWVPDGVRRAILRVCAECLSPNGIAFISYNAKPGGAIRGVVRDVMRYHTRHFQSAPEQLREATELVRFLSYAKGVTADSYRSALHEVLSKLETGQPGYLYHDLLGAESEPFFLSEVVRDATQAGMFYAGDARFTAMFSDHLSADVRSVLETFRSDRVRFEQYLDFVDNCAFRESLFAKSPVSHFDWKALGGAQFACALSYHPPEGDRMYGSFRDERGREVRVDEGLCRHVVTTLARAWPESLSVDAIKADYEEIDVLKMLCSLLRQGIVEAEVVPRRVLGAPPTYPCTTAYARYVATRNSIVTSPIHFAAPLSDPARAIVAQMDGSTSLATINATLSGLLEGEDVEAQIERAWREVVESGFVLSTT